jgi:anti-sigma factor RsiW
MTVTTHWTDRLSDYLDDEMSATERAACDAHLAVCSACRETLDGLRWVVTTARADADQAPSANLWPGVLQRMVPADAGGRADFPQPDFASARSRGTRQFVFTLPQLALAASLLIAVSAGVAYLAAGRVVSPPTATETVVQAFAEPVMAPSADVARADFADAQYDEAVADLEKILADSRDELNPQTVMVIERSLQAIDEAIQQSRAALDADPANTFLNSHLADARRKKLDLLRRATAIHSISGD